MTLTFILLILTLAAIETLASYIRRIYAEFGKILTREEQENLDAWEELVEPQLGLSREHATICAAVLQQLALGLIALEFGAVLFDRAPHLARPTPARLRRPSSAWSWSSSSATSFCPRCSSTARKAAGRSGSSGRFVFFYG